MAENNKHPSHSNESKAKLIITLIVILALVVLSLARLFQPEFKVDLIVYAILGGILFGVGGIRELLGSIQITPPSQQDDKDDKKFNGNKKGKRR